MREQGLFVAWKERYWPKNDMCKPPDHAQPMKLSDVQGLFYIGFGLLLLATNILFVENMLHHHRDSQKKPIIGIILSIKQKLIDTCRRSAFTE